MADGLVRFGMAIAIRARSLEKRVAGTRDMGLIKVLEQEGC